MSRRGALKEFPLDTLEAGRHESQDPAAGQVFAEIGKDRPTAAKLLLAQLDAGLDPRTFIDAARLMVFQKGDNAHDYKYSSAVLEDYYHVSPAWRNRYLVASVFNLKGSGQPDNKLVERTRAALRA